MHGPLMHPPGLLDLGVDVVLVRPMLLRQHVPTILRRPMLHLGGTELAAGAAAGGARLLAGGVRSSRPLVLAAAVLPWVVLSSHG